MRKLLVIAASAVLLSTSAYADMTVGGAIRYDLTKADGATTTSGISKSEITFGASEDLGNGMSVAAKVGVNGLGRGETVAGTDATISISGGFGSVRVGQIEAGNGIIGRGLGGAPVIGADGTVLAGSVNLDSLKYTAPTIGGLTASIGASRKVDATTDYSYTAALSGAVAGVNAGVDYNETSKRVRVSASTELAGLTVGAGWSGNETGKDDSSVFGVSMPFGAMTVGAARSIGNGTANEFGVKYALAKSTSVQFAYQDVTGNSTAANNTSTARVRLEYKF